MTHMVRAYLLKLVTNAEELTRRDYLIGWILFTAIFALIPVIFTSFWVRMVLLANIFALFTLSWNVLAGHTNYLSFGHSFLIGAAGYMTAILTTTAALPMWLSIPLSIAFTLFAGLIIFVPSLSLRGAYFTFVTLVMPIIAERFVIQQSDITGGVRGIIGIPRFSSNLFVNYYLSLALMIITAAFVWTLFRSDFGTILRMINESEDLVQNSGINPVKFKLAIFMLSALIAGVGGVFKVHYLGSVTIDSVLYLTLSINIVIAAIIGGRGSVAGAIGGAYFFVLFDAYLQPFLSTPFRNLIFFVLGIIMVSLAPAGFIPRAITYLQTRGSETEDQTGVAAKSG